MHGQIENQKALQESILLIGPMGTGKSTVGKLLAQKFPNLQRIKVDEYRWRFFEKYTDYSREKEKIIRQEKGFRGVYEYWKKYEAALVMAGLKNINASSIIDFGAGQSVYEDPRMLVDVQRAFSGAKNVFLILPSEDKEECKKQLQERMERRQYKGMFERNSPRLTEEQRISERVEVTPDELAINNHFIDSPSNYTLATHIIYTNGADAREVAEAIAAVYEGRELSKESKIKVVENSRRVVRKPRSKNNEELNQENEEIE